MICPDVRACPEKAHVSPDAPARMDSAGWSAAHLRPRDVFIWGAVTLLVLLAGLVWVTRRETGEASTLLSLILGAVSTLGGYYQGHKDAEAADARVRAAEEALRQMQGELRRMREELAEAKGTLSASVGLLDEDRNKGGEG